MEKQPEKTRPVCRFCGTQYRIQADDGKFWLLCPKGLADPDPDHKAVSEVHDAASSIYSKWAENDESELPYYRQQ